MQKPKLYLLSGLPGSGKSTIAKKLIKENKYTYRINRDALRQCLYMEDFNPSKEKVVTAAAHALLIKLLKDRFNVILDNMHLGEQHVNEYRTVANEYDYDLEIIKVDTPVEECIRRDELRRLKGERFVGAKVIRNKAFHNGLMVRQPEPFVVSDVDGTICNIEHRVHWVKGDHKNWPKFFEGIANDPPRQEIINLLHAHKAEGRQVILCSGRNEKYRGVTQEWLNKHNVPYDALYLRADTDSRDDTITKAEMIYDNLDESKILVWYDDRPKVIRMLREKKINVIDVGEGVEF
jgi:predicted kinase